MKKVFVAAGILVTCISFIAITSNEDPVFIPPSVQRVGNADSGYRYIVTGDYVKSGPPFSLYNLAFKKEKIDLLNRGGDNGDVRYDLNVVRAFNNEKIIVPNCFQCHGD